MFFTTLRKIQHLAEFFFLFAVFGCCLSIKRAHRQHSQDGRGKEEAWQWMTE